MTRLISRFAPIAFSAFALFASSSALAQSTCKDCGQVQSIRYVEEKGKTSGVGLVAGGVLGGVLGHQIGGGTGKTVATVAGAAGGAYVGNKVEQNRNTKGHWEVSLKMDSGNMRTLTFSSQPTVKEGERVKVVDGDGGKRLALLAN